MMAGAQSQTSSPPAGARLAAAGLVVLMALGSIAMWLASPVAWLWVASQVVSTQTPTLGGYALAFVGIVVTCVALTKALGVLDRMHMALLRPADDRVHRATWLRSMRDGRGPQPHDESVLARVMVVSVGLAFLVAGVWYFGFAGSSIS